MASYNVSITGNLSFLNGVLTLNPGGSPSISYSLTSGVSCTVSQPVFPANGVGFNLGVNNKNYRFNGRTANGGVSYNGNVVGPASVPITGGDEDDPWVATARTTEDDLAIVGVKPGKKPGKKAAKKPAKKAAKKPAKKAAKKPAKKAAKKPAKKAAKKPAKKAAKKPAKKAAKKPAKKAAKKPARKPVKKAAKKPMKKAAKKR